MELSGKTALITGATGLVGGRLAERLLTEEGMQVRALVRNPAKASKLANLGATLVPGDITQPETLKVAAHGCQLVFHAAAWVSESGTREQVWAVNVTGTQNVVNAALKAGAQRLVHVSSCAVYGSIRKFHIHEDVPTRRRGNLYADSKIEAEEVVFRAREQGLPVVVARASQVYGPGSYQFTIRPVQVIRAGKMVLVDNGRFLAKPVYLDNLVDGLILCAKVDAAAGQAFNLTDGYTVSWREFFGAYGRMLGIESFPSAPYPLAWGIALLNELKAAAQGKKTGLNRKAVKSLRSLNSFSNRKARQVLGWQPRVDFEEGMRRTEAWLRAEGYLNGEWLIVNEA
ncbi:MAG: NAD(P)-dependent oxidoreductase [Anaerolineae bacterium]